MQSGTFYSRGLSLPSTPLGQEYQCQCSSPCSTVSTPASEISTISQKLDYVLTAVSEPKQLLAKSKEEGGLLINMQLKNCLESLRICCKS